MSPIILEAHDLTKKYRHRVYFFSRLIAGIYRG